MIGGSIWVLIQDRNGVKHKFFHTPMMARKTSVRRPSYYIRATMQPTQGGTLWVLAPGEQWRLEEDIPGEYNVATRGLYTNDGKAKR